jgi:general secretion pathway protein A
MYLEHFNLDHEPFSIAPDPNFLFLSEGHGEALAHLMYGFSHGGFVLITGEVGTGKTTLLRDAIRKTPPELDVAFILNPRLTVKELLETICDELGVSYDANRVHSVKQFIDVLNRHLLKTHASGRSTVVIIDEAQNLSPAVLEQIRLLTNLETNEKKLMRIILLGQPELDTMLQRQELRQLAQRITARYHLGALSRDDCVAYVKHRLACAGGRRDLFTDGALRRLYRLSGGTPRLINVIADRALLGAYVDNAGQVVAGVVDRAAAEVLGKRAPTHLVWGAATVMVAATLMAWAWFFLPERSAVVAANPPPAVPAESAMPSTTPPPAEAEPASRNVGATDARDRAADSKPADEASDEASDDGSDDAATAPASATPGVVAPTIVRPHANAYRTQREAFDALFATWGHDETLADTDIPCDVAPSRGLQCLSLNGSWADIERLNLPVVLELWDAGDDAFYGAIVGGDERGYTLVLGRERITITPRDLRDAWFGRYLLLWQTPPGYRGSLREGDRHGSVAWLRESLATIANVEPAAGDPERFDAALTADVLRFQTEEGLLADGIVGPATWIRLAERLGTPGPRLH